MKNPFIEFFLDFPSGNRYKSTEIKDESAQDYLIGYFSAISDGSHCKLNKDTVFKLITLLKELKLSFVKPIRNYSFTFYRYLDSMYAYILSKNSDYSDKEKNKLFDHIENKSLDRDLDLYFNFIIENWDSLKDQNCTYRSLQAFACLIDGVKLEKSKAEVMRLIEASFPQLG